MTGSPAFYRAAIALFVLSGLFFGALGIVAPMIRPEPIDMSLFLLLATATWTGIIWLTIGIYNWLARR